MDIGRPLILAGLALVVVGVVCLLLPKGVNPFGWFGNMPGDINYRNGNTVIFAPIVSMLLVSVMVSLILWLARRL